MQSETNEMLSLSLALSRAGHLYLYANPDHSESEMISKPIAEKIHSFFSAKYTIGMLRLGLSVFDSPLPPSVAFWQKFTHLSLAEICKYASAGEKVALTQAEYPESEIKQLIAQAPFFRGAEYLNDEIAFTLWRDLIDALREELKPFNNRLDTYLSTFNSAWNAVGKVCFHLAENKNHATFPFAFLATYTTGLSTRNRTQHLPLGQALEEYADPSKRTLLLSLLLPVHKAAEKSVFLKNIVDSGVIFKPLAWSASDAYEFLKDIVFFESAGIVVRVPNWWNPKKPPRPMINVTIGKKDVNTLGMDSLLDFDMQLTLPTGEALTQSELKKLFSGTENLVQIKGQWVQVDNEKLKQVLSHWKSIERQVQNDGLSFSEGLRLLSGFSQQQLADELPEMISSWSTVIEGDWLNQTLGRLRHPDESGINKLQQILKKYLSAELRPYQQRGVQWLWWLYNMRLGGCLADDMGLGKTIQVICLLLLIKYNSSSDRRTHLLVLPASLLDNWQVEIKRFAPSLSIWIVHGSADNIGQPDFSTVDLVITTYGTLNRVSWLNEASWDVVILDEAQAIKNPAAKQTRASKALNSRVRFALTGTPVENRLLDLWSLFDFIAPGLLGSSRAFADYSKASPGKNGGEERVGQFYASVRGLIKPYVLRRLKSDKQIINDLPDKTELQAYCALSKQQAVLYQQAVNELAQKLENQDSNINRRGLVLSYLLRFKQICNHPSQWLGHGEYSAELSGKFRRLKELCDVIAEKQEKVLIFSQFREIIPALSAYLAQVFNREGLYLHGATSVKERAKRVKLFQQEQGPPFFILSLKAGGSGLNLTAASHVIHFDRWWNPAVENQATDRAYRIGQKKNVLVHKFICRGTIEEKIDVLLNSKKSIANEMLGQDNEIVLTELSDTELMNMVTLDIHRALEENQGVLNE